MLRKLHVGAAQIHSGGSITENLARVERQARSAAVVGVEVLLFAEGALCGYDYGMTRESVDALAEPLDGPNCLRVSGLAQETSVTILIGFFERDGEAIYNSCLVARPDGSRGVQRKHALTEGEKNAGLTPGPKERSIFDFCGVPCVIVICADTGIEERHEEQLQQGVQYQFIPTGGGGKIQDYLHEADLASEEA
ncbi:MAG: nitrilase-related carbon-nitrogen hydrolase, partial [Planctomycetota bacterium]